MSLRLPQIDWKARLKAHRGLATWGDRLLPLAEFRAAAAAHGRELGEAERARLLEAWQAPRSDGVAVEGPYSRIVVFGGIYNNSFALEALLDEAHRLGAEAIYCLGDFGGFGPTPEKVWPLLAAGGVLSIQGNYEESLSSGRTDCNCGYADPRDNHFALLSYSYTEKNCSPAYKAYMGSHPRRRRVRVGDRELLLVHGSPRRINEFLFASTTPAPYLEKLLDQEGCDGILCTHTGLQWQKHLPSGRDVVNVGVIGRPANDGATHVWYSLIEASGAGLRTAARPLRYDFEGLARAMETEALPPEFVATIRTGWWTTCLEILPARERAVSKF